jgi:hypothetical protein
MADMEGSDDEFSEDDDPESKHDKFREITAKAREIEA